MSDPSSKIIITKTSDGKTKRVVVKRVKKTIKLKARPAKVAPSAGEKGSGTATPALAKTSSGDANKTARSPSTRSSAPTSPSARRGSRPPTAAGARGRPTGTSSFAGDRPKSGGTYAKPAARPSSGAGAKKSKIYITKKDSKNSSSFGRASSKRKFKRSHGRFRGDDRLGEGGGFDSYSHDREEINAFANVPKKIEIPEVVSIKELAHKLNLKALQLIKKFFSLGVVNLRVNDNIDVESAQIVCNELGCTVEVISLLEQTKVETDDGSPEDYVSRPAILSIMGHVDHGKTTLLGALTGEKLSAESGGITQHIQAYSVNTGPRKLIFLDTPGHSSFFSMRAKGIKITDILVLIIAITESVKPQTLEVLALLKSSDIPFIIAVTKSDLVPIPAEREKALRELKTVLGQYEVGLTEWGGKTPLYLVSAETKEGMPELLAGIEAMANEQDLQGNPKVRAYGYVLESRVSMGKGHVITLVVKNGSMRTGDAYLCHQSYGRVRAIFNEKNKKIDHAGPGDVVEVIGLTSLVPSGKFFQVMENEKEARKTSEKRQELEKVNVASSVKKVTVSNLFSVIQKESIKEFRVIVKADTYGSAEAIHETLKQLKNDEVRTSVLHFGVGAVSENDIQLAVTTQAEIIVFKLRTPPKLESLCEQEKIKLHHYEIIYDIVDAVKERLSGMLGDDREETVEGRVSIKEVFKISGLGKVAGCEVLEGKVQKSHEIRILRDSAVVYTGSLASLRRFKDEVSEVTAGQDCGLSFKNFENFQAKDIIEVFTTKIKKRELKISEKAPLAPAPASAPVAES